MLLNQWYLVILAWIFAISKVSGQIGPDYNPLEAPENQTGDPLNINCEILSLDVIDVDVEKHTVKLSVSFMLKWQDNRLEDSSSELNSKSKMVGIFFSLKSIRNSYTKIFKKYICKSLLSFFSFLRKKDQHEFQGIKSGHLILKL